MGFVVTLPAIVLPTIEQDDHNWITDLVSRTFYRIFKGPEASYDSICMM